jgi:hypothetical protein
MNEPIDHHYIPVFYLSQWCDPTGKVVRYYRPRKEVIASPITPKSTGYEPQLYTLNGYPDEQKQWIEKHYMGPVVDEPASKALRILLAHNNLNLTPETRTDWVRFLMSLSLRNPEAVANTNAEMRAGLADKFSRHSDWYEANKKANDPPTFVEFVQNNMPLVLENSGKLYLPDFIENQGIGTVLIQMRWFTFDLGNSAFTLLTGDRPFIRTFGLKDQRCVVVLPISPRFAFVATHAAEVDLRLRPADPAQLAKDINARIVAQAVKHVYGASDHHLRFVENRLAPVK